MYNMSCPICLKDIDTEKVVGNKAYCGCGYAIDLSHKSSSSDSSARRGVFSIVLLTCFIVAAIVHAFNWDTYFFTVIPLKLKQITKTANASNLLELADICAVRKKLSCEADALEGVLKLDATQSAKHLRVAAVYAELNSPELVISTLSDYFRKGGKDLEAHYSLAKALAQVGRFKESQKQYRYLIKAHAKSPKYQVARSYVELLISQSDYTTAKQVIEQYRRAGQNSGLFLEKEWKIVNTQLSRARLRTSNNKI